MQFYLNGYRPGDPFMEEPHPSVAERSDGLPEEVDVLIIGCGPAGLVLAAQMANLPEISTAVIDRRDGPLQVGQADGVACRTVEMFEAFGLANRLVSEAYWVNEVSFWRPSPEDPAKIARTGRITDVEPGLSEFPHVIVNQARMLAYLLDHMERSPARLTPFYAPSMITAGATHQHLAQGFEIGTRLHSAPVVRLADAKPVQLGHAARADAAWRVYVFADRSGSAAGDLFEFLTSAESPVERFTPAGAEPDSVIDVRAVFQQGHRDLAVDEMPPVLLPKKGRFGLIDYEKTFCPDPDAEDIFDLRGVNRETGCTVVVRPDQHVSHVLPLHDHTALAGFFASILIDATR